MNAIEEKVQQLQKNPILIAYIQDMYNRAPSQRISYNDYKELWLAVKEENEIK